MKYTMYSPGGGGRGDAAGEAEWQNRGRMDFLLEWATLDSALAAARAAPAHAGGARGVEEEAIDLVALLPPPPRSLGADAGSRILALRRQRSALFLRPPPPRHHPPSIGSSRCSSA